MTLELATSAAGWRISHLWLPGKFYYDPNSCLRWTDPGSGHRLQISHDCSHSETGGRCPARRCGSAFVSGRNSPLRSGQPQALRSSFGEEANQQPKNETTDVRKPRHPASLGRLDSQARDTVKELHDRP